MVFPRSRHYWKPEDYHADYTYKAHARLYTSLEPIRLGSSVRCIAVFYDESGTLQDPDSAPSIYIYDPDGTAEVSAGTMTEDGDYSATYYYTHDIGSDDKAGLWKFRVTASLTIDDTFDIDQLHEFEVYKAS